MRKGRRPQRWRTRSSTPKPSVGNGGLGPARSGAALAGPELRTALADPDGRATLADPALKVQLAEPEAKVSSLEASDECVLTEECIDQYLWSVYERAPKVDTIKVEERVKVKFEKDGKSRTVTKTVAKFVNENGKIQMPRRKLACRSRNT